MAKGPNLPNIQELISAGIDPKTGLPVKVASSMGSALKANIRTALRIMDEQAAVRKYTWYNLPDSLDGELIERILYYRGQGAFFYMKTDNSFYFLPYALDGTIDVYGRYTGITPLPFNGTASDGKEKPWITGLKRIPQYGIKYDELKMEDLENKCVLLHDYTKQISQNVVPRQQIQEGIIDLESDILPFMRTALMAGTGIAGMKVQGADQSSSVEDAARAIYQAALKGEYWIPIDDKAMQLEELTTGTTTNPQDYLLAMQSVDNIRLSLHGLDAGGIFEKKQHVNDMEMMMNQSPTSLVYEDGLTIRQNFCDIVNSIWGLGIWCDAGESAMGVDANMDGQIQNDETPGADLSEGEGGTSDDTNV
jgi:plasmid stability protein